MRDGVERLRRGDVSWVSGPPILFGVDAGSRRVALALGTWMGVGASAKRALDGEERDLDTGVFSGVWRRDRLLELGGWDPGWPVNEDSELASRFFAAGERIVCLPSMGARYVPRATLPRARAAVLALRLLPREDGRPAPGEPAPAATCSRRAWPRPSRSPCSAAVPRRRLALHPRCSPTPPPWARRARAPPDPPLRATRC